VRPQVKVAKQQCTQPHCFHNTTVSLAKGVRQQYTNKLVMWSPQQQLLKWYSKLASDWFT